MNLSLPKEFQSYKPNVTFNINSEHFIVKIAEKKEELLGTFRLRNSVFYEEWTGKSSESGLDIDKYDRYADHLIIIKKDINEVIGTYRLISNKVSDYFYTKEFFNIEAFLNKKPGNKVEMGRACIRKDLRNRKFIQQVWLGLARYFRHTFSRYMFGCVSIVHTTPEYAASVYKTLLETKKVDKETLLQPVEKYKIKCFDSLISKVTVDESNLLKLPRLFLWYLSVGAKIHSQPIYDPDFNSYDFFISLDFKNIGKPKLVNRYKDAIYLRDTLP